MRKGYVFIGLALILFVAAWFSFSPAVTSGEASPEVGAAAPEFTLTSISGKTVSLEEQRGKVVLINFWATWCPPCRQEMPGLMAAYEEYQGDLEVMAVDHNETADLVQEFVDFLGIELFDPLLDPTGQIADLYHVNSFPTSFFVDEEGVIRYIHIGLLNESQLDTYLTQLGVSE